jgi:hypothetical protein
VKVVLLGDAAVNPQSLFPLSIIMIIC